MSMSEVGTIDARGSGAGVHVASLDEIRTYSGLDFLLRITDGSVAQPPIAATLGFRLSEVAPGLAVFTMTPELRHYNPIGTVHGGFAATLLDSALACAIFSTMRAGEAWTVHWRLPPVR